VATNCGMVPLVGLWYYIELHCACKVHVGVLFGVGVEICGVLAVYTIFRDLHKIKSVDNAALTGVRMSGVTHI
jgi:hypothetical protein